MRVKIGYLLLFVSHALARLGFRVAGLARKSPVNREFLLIEGGRS